MADEDGVLRGPRTNDQPSDISLGVHYMNCLTKYGDRVAQLQEVDGKEHSRTFSELLLQGKRVSCFLRERDIGLDDVVWICCGNNLAYTPVLLGTLFVGATVAPVLPFYHPSDMLHLLGVIQPQLVICNCESEEALSAAVKQCSVKINLVPLRLVVEAMEHDYMTDNFQLTHVPDPASHVALVMCSSGTSGKPKGVEVRDQGFLFQTDFPLYNFKNPTGEEGTVAMNLSNPNWATAQLAILTTLSRGMLLILLENFTEEVFLSIVQKYKVNHAMLKPFELSALVKWPDTELFDTGSLEGVTFSGSTVSRGVVEQAEQKLRTNIVTLYGMTETMCVIRPPFNNKEKATSLGCLLKNVDAKVVDPDTGTVLGPHRNGELCIRTPSIMRGYRNNPEATASVFDKDGFYYTGDSVHFDEDGFFFFHDRIKDIIKYKQHQQIAAGDIEEVLMAHAGVLAASVVGIPHETDFERATAFVVARPGSTVTEQELLALVEEKLPSYKWLHGGLNFIDALPKTASGKIVKRELRAMLAKRQC